MIKESPTTLRIESITASHFTKIAATKASSRLLWLQRMLLRSWLAQIEQTFSAIIPITQPKSFIALEKGVPRSMLILNPANNKGTCWSVSFVDFYEKPQQHSPQEIKRMLLETVLNDRKNILKNWLIKLNCIEVEQLALAREFGFQPIKKIKSWSPPEKKTTKKKLGLNLPVGTEWQQINKRNASALWRLEQASESIHLRQIIDKESGDLLKQNKSFSGLLLAKTKESSTAIAGLSHKNEIEGRVVLQLVRDTAWDRRLINSLPIIINKVGSEFVDLEIEISSEDNEMANMFTSLGWNFNGEKLLLVRSLWKRQNKKTLIKGKTSLKEIIDKLNPGQSPLPTPSLGRRI